MERFTFEVAAGAGTLFVSKRYGGGDEAKKRKWGLWYVGAVGFATQEEAQAYIDLGMKHRNFADEIAPPSRHLSNGFFGYSLTHWVIALVLSAAVFGGVLWLFSGPEKQTQHVGREFASMDDCLTFIMRDINDSLEFITDKPGDISGRSTKKRLFYRCELKVTGSRGPVLEGRWDRPK